MPNKDDIVIDAQTGKPATIEVSDTKITVLGLVIDPILTSMSEKATLGENLKRLISEYDKQFGLPTDPYKRKITKVRILKAMLNRHYHKFF